MMDGGVVVEERRFLFVVVWGICKLNVTLLRKILQRLRQWVTRNYASVISVMPLNILLVIDKSVGVII